VVALLILYITPKKKRHGSTWVLRNARQSMSEVNAWRRSERARQGGLTISFRIQLMREQNQ
jgi:hypothetical protein